MIIVRGYFQSWYALAILNLFCPLGRQSIELLRLLFVAAPRDVIELPDDEEEVPLKERRRRGRASSGRTTEGQVPQSTSTPETVVQRSGDPARANVSFANPLLTDRPSASTAQVSASPAQLHASDPVIAPTVLPSSLFVTHHTPDDSAGAAKEAILQANLMMEQMKVVHKASQAAYNASSSLHVNVKVS